ncbi:MAG: DUF192 domain-containing protein [Candidatus Zambryskibacteria bacterium]|nr:DUF192 domain-containing protein [Candidatus Zambryskibacteria bacterium]
MESLKNTFFFIIGITIIAWSVYMFLQGPAPAHYQKVSTSQVDTLRIDDSTITVEIADTDEERSIGLSGRETLPSGQGLLFIFDETGLYGFWMYDMNYPIDIVWINSDWTVAGVQSGIDPDTYPKLFYPPSPIKYVLEINSGDASRLGIDTGSRLYLGTGN